jgi:hypothetical protein
MLSILYLWLYCSVFWLRSFRRFGLLRSQDTAISSRRCQHCLSTTRRSYFSYYALGTMACSIHSALCSMPSALCPMHYALCTMYYELYSMPSALCSVARNSQPVTRDSHRETRNPYLATRNRYLVTRNTQPTYPIFTTIAAAVSPAAHPPKSM